MKTTSKKAFIGYIAFLGCFLLLGGIAYLAYYSGSDDYKPRSNVIKIDHSDCHKCTAMYEITLYPSDEWFDTGIKLKQGHSVFLSPKGSTSGFHESVVIKLNGKQTNSIGRKPARYDQNLLVGFKGGGDYNIFFSYRTVIVQIQPWEF